VLLRAEPTKQKTSRPERKGIARAVSPRKWRKEGRNVPTDNSRRVRQTGQECDGGGGSRCIAIGANQEEGVS
jgi:hypothetical protein